jgi:hypothetical protein
MNGAQCHLRDSEQLMAVEARHLFRGTFTGWPISTAMPLTNSNPLVSATLYYHVSPLYSVCRQGILTNNS